MLSQQVYQRKPISRLNVFLLLGLLGFSMLGAWSTSVAQEGAYGAFIKHVFSMCLGLGAFVGISLSGYRFLQRWSAQLYGLLIFLLVLVLLIGPRVAGAKRWLYIGGFSFQPSELAKLILVITLSYHLSHIRKWDPLQFGLLIAHIALPCLLVFREPDLGMTLVLSGLFMSLLLVSPASFWILSVILAPMMSIGLYFSQRTLWRVYLLVGGLSLIGSYLALRWKRLEGRFLLIFGTGLLAFSASIVWLGEWVWTHLKPYQQQRILTFISPNPDQLSSGYQVNQSKIAVGAGGLKGQGLFQGSQTQLGFVPEQHTDFIFSALAEETGFLGASLLLILFAVMIFRILWIGLNARESSQLYICTGVASLMLMQVLINVGMNMEIMPVTGVTLPLISYGGTSMIIQLSLLGLVESVYLQQQRAQPIGSLG